MTLEEFVFQYFNVILAVVLFAIGWGFGRRAERNHLKSLAIHEEQLGHIGLSSERFVMVSGECPVLVTGCVVIAQDRFKMVMASFLSLFGKNLTTYESLLERARREAVVRLKQDAQRQGCSRIYGLRFESSEVDGGVEVLAYGTAVIEK